MRKQPFSLRPDPRPAQRSPEFTNEATAALGAGLLAACLIVPEARAQGAPTQLPALTVEAPAQRARPRAAAPRQVAPRPARNTQVRQASRPRTAAPAVAAPEPAAAQAGAPQPADANPRATPGAPYKVDRPASTKMTERLIDTPRSVDVISKEVIQDKGATSLRELARTTPGVTLGTGEGGNAFGDRIFIRGFDARNDMYIDGVRESGVTTRETFMVEQVDVIKGPSGSISGRGATGGAINVVTKKPLERNFYNFSLEGGNASQKRATVDLNHNINEFWAVRFNGLVQDSKTPGRSSEVFDKRYGAAGAVTFKPSDAFKFTLDGYYMKFDQMPDWGVPFDIRKRQPFTESGLNRKAFYGLTQRDFQENQQGLVTGTAEWTVSPLLTITSKLRYGQTTTDYIASKPGTPDLSNANPYNWRVPASPASRYQVNRMLASQTDGTWKFETFGFKHTLVTGVELSRENTEIQTYTGLATECFPNCAGTNPYLNLWAPEGKSIELVTAPTRTGTPTEVTVKTAAVYVADTINWNDRVYANFGVRYDDYTVTNQPFGAFRIKRNDGLVNWNAGLTYKLIPSFAVYGSVATSSNPVGSELDGGGDDYGGLTAANRIFKPERNRMYEVGAKWEALDQKLLLTAALFQTEKDNARETVGGVLSDTAEYRVRGIELGVAGNITERLSVFGGYVNFDSKVTAARNTAILGNKLANIAHESFNLLVKYRWTDAFTIGGQATWKGEILGGHVGANMYTGGVQIIAGQRVTIADGFNTLPGGWRFDAMAEYAINKNLSIKGQVNNIFDAKLYDGFYRSSAPYVYIAPGRSATISLNAKF